MTDTHYHWRAAGEQEWTPAPGLSRFESPRDAAEQIATTLSGRSWPLTLELKDCCGGVWTFECERVCVVHSKLLSVPTTWERGS